MRAELSGVYTPGLEAEMLRTREEMLRVRRFSHAPSVKRKNTRRQRMASITNITSTAPAGLPFMEKHGRPGSRVRQEHLMEAWCKSYVARLGTEQQIVTHRRDATALGGTRASLTPLLKVPRAQTAHGDIPLRCSLLAPPPVPKTAAATPTYPATWNDEAANRAPGAGEVLQWAPWENTAQAHHKAYFLTKSPRQPRSPYTAVPSERKTPISWDPAHSSASSVSTLRSILHQGLRDRHAFSPLIKEARNPLSTRLQARRKQEIANKPMLHSAVLNG